ncbi:DUF1958 domain-containing protein [Floricoccus penangensis]|uniref:DUF1958 domain-containing protein n=1 Tax=Floricoccus penangensis TaxID=1859475 RepID=UPI002040762A|nr:DUF1958 domain-containing protein [Floricoccus penangensis]
MKKIFFLLTTALSMSSIMINSSKTALADEVNNTGDIVQVARNFGYQVNEINRPKSSIVIDAENGQVLWQDNPDIPRNPASISKLMTIYLVFEALHNGQISMDTIVTATPTDQAIGKLHAISNNNIVTGVGYPVRELITMTLVPSSNIATVMLANLVSNNDAGGFVTKMNSKAQEIGMTNSYFNNASGAEAVAFSGMYLPQGYDQYAGNVTTSRDLSILAFNMLKNYPEILDFTKNPQVTAMKGTPYEEHFETYNYSTPGVKEDVQGSVYGYPGVDGLKTGSSPGGAFNYVATCLKNNMRVIEVIMGVGDWSDQDGEYYRHPFGNALLDKTYQDYSYQTVLPAGEHDIDGKKVKIDSDLMGVVKKNSTPEFKYENDELILSNTLPLVNDKMIPVETKYTEVKENKKVKEEKKTLKTTTSSSKSEDQSDDNSHEDFFKKLQSKLIEIPNQILYSLIGIVSGTILFLISRIFKNKKFISWFTALTGIAAIAVGIINLFYPLI